MDHKMQYLKNCHNLTWALTNVRFWNKKFYISPFRSYQRHKLLANKKMQKAYIRYLKSELKINWTLKHRSYNTLFCFKSKFIVFITFKFYFNSAIFVYEYRTVAFIFFDGMGSSNFIFYFCCPSPIGRDHTTIIWRRHSTIRQYITINKTELHQLLGTYRACNVIAYFIQNEIS